MENATEIQAHILLKVAEDVEFRERLASDPKGVIEAETGREVPDDALVLIKQAIAGSLEKVSADTPLTKEEMVQVVGGNSSEQKERDEYCNENPDDWVCSSGPSGSPG